MTVIQVGLVDVTGSLDRELVEAAAAALNIQVTRDLPQFWNVHATVRHLPDPTRIPVGVWPVCLVAALPPGEGGVHLDQHNQPYALVVASAASAAWTIAASHELIEMLVDPWGNRIQTSRAIVVGTSGVRDGTGEYGYLVEACDPCEAPSYAYAIQGVAVSDFITPRYYDPVRTAGTRYSFAGNIVSPRGLLPGGYLVCRSGNVGVEAGALSGPQAGDAGAGEVHRAEHSRLDRRADSCAHGEGRGSQSPTDGGVRQRSREHARRDDGAHVLVLA